MNKKWIVAALTLIAVGFTIFPATAGTYYGLNKNYFSNDGSLCGARGECENWGVTTRFWEVVLCEIVN